ncbi:MAG: hypothetical protein Q4C77_10840 [Eubacteriales bacterium]|nr:hypothetical protein [Eubacteriales bacterium]
MKGKRKTLTAFLAALFFTLLTSVQTMAADRMPFGAALSDRSAVLANSGNIIVPTGIIMSAAPVIIVGLIVVVIVVVLIIRSKRREEEDEE